MSIMIFLASCILSESEHQDLMNMLDDTAISGDTSTPLLESRSTKYAHFYPDGCIDFSWHPTALSTPEWSFSFRLTDELIEGSYNMFQVGLSRILLVYNSLESSIFFCEPFGPGDLLEDKCTTIPFDFNGPPQPQDRLTLTRTSTGVLSLFHNKNLLVSANDITNRFSQDGALSFGCPATVNEDLFNQSISWKGGIDSLFLFNKDLRGEQVEDLFDAESSDSFENLFQFNIVEAYWNLGEDTHPKIIDSVGSNDGLANDKVEFRSYDAE